MGEGETDRDRLRIQRGHGRGDARGFGFRQRRNDVPERVDALIDLDGARARHDRFRLPAGERIEIGARLAADDEDVAETLRHRPARPWRPLRVRNAFVPTVKPWTKRSMSAGPQTGRRRDARDAVGDPGGRAGRLRGHFVQMHASGPVAGSTSTSTRSVKVPPTSAAR